MDMSEFFPDLPQVPSIDKAGWIIKYETAKRIVWSKLVEKRRWPSDAGIKVHVGRIHYSQPAWSDGFMLEAAEVPTPIKKLKGYWESLDEKIKDYNHLLPDIPPGSPEVKPLATIVGDKHHPDVVYLSDSTDERHEICVQKKYADYFVIRYPGLRFIMVGPTTSLVVQHKREIVGLIMPIKVDQDILERARHVVEETVEPVEPPPPLVKPPPEKPTIDAIANAEAKYSATTLRDMARKAGINPYGDKRYLIKQLIKAGELK